MENTAETDNTWANNARVNNARVNNAGVYVAGVDNTQTRDNDRLGMAKDIKLDIVEFKKSILINF